MLIPIDESGNIYLHLETQQIQHLHGTALSFFLAAIVSARSDWIG